MPAVGHMRRAGGAFGQSFSVDLRTVAGRHLHLLRTRMALEPAHEALLGAVRDKIHDLMAFEIDEDGAVGAALLESEVVHAQNPDLADLRQRRGLDPPQQSVAGGHNAQLQSQPVTRLPPSSRAIASSASSSRSVLRAR